MTTTMRSFGPTGVRVPVIGQGTWKLGSRNQAQEVAALRRGIELGLTHIDTAEMYGEGRAEETIAEAVAGLPRERLFIVSKVLPSHASRKGTVAACERSLRRLRMDYLDGYLLHWPGDVAIAETMGGMEDLVSQGKIRSLGVSNFDLDELEGARRALTRERIACNQVLYHLEERGIERRLLDYCAKHAIAVVGYSPFGGDRGAFPGPHTRGGKVLAEIAAKHGATPRRIALAFLVRKDPLFAIPKAARIEHVEDNAAALRVTLDEADVRAIDAAFPVRSGRGLATS